MRTLQIVYRTLIGLGFVSAAYASAGVIESEWAQARAGRAFAEARLGSSGDARLEPARNTLVPSRMPSPERGEPVGRIEIPRIDLSAMVLEGDDARTLRRGVGHLARTPLPGEGGNTCLAGHRDTFFRALKDVRVGDVIRFATLHDAYAYRVDSLLIVDPGDVWVLGPSSEPTLTLVSCYPFYFVGRAPKRFVVRASAYTSAVDELTRY
ncbi:MAG: class D sortase [bacterium]